jgi:hypothetical protein
MGIHGRRDSDDSRRGAQGEEGARNLTCLVENEEEFVFLIKKDVIGQFFFDDAQEKAPVRPASMDPSWRS